MLDKIAISFDNKNEQHLYSDKGFILRRKYFKLTFCLYNIKLIYNVNC